MSDTRSFPLNPYYGNGAFRRRILLVSASGAVSAALEDDFHGFRLSLNHDGATITGVKAESLRIPGSTCREAPALLASLVGCALTADRAQFRGYADARAHCTHLHDLLWLACAQSLRPGAGRQYDVTVPDLSNGRSAAEVRLDGALVHSWSIDLQQVIAPAAHRGQPLQQGFGRWVSDAFSGAALEAAYVLRMGIFVGRARRYDVEAVRRDMPAASGPPVCHSFQPVVRLRYVPRLGETRDFFANPERLLKFL